MRAETIQVPDDHATIQAAIVAAQNGDEIVVASGAYYSRECAANADNLLLAPRLILTIGAP